MIIACIARQNQYRDMTKLGVSPQTFRRSRALRTRPRAPASPMPEGDAGCPPTVRIRYAVAAAPQGLAATGLKPIRAQDFDLGDGDDADMRAEKAGNLL